MTTEMVIATALRQQAPEHIAEAMAGKFRLSLFTDPERTVGMGVLFVPLAHLAGAETFVRLACGGAEPTERRVVNLDPERQ